MSFQVPTLNQFRRLIALLLACFLSAFAQVTPAFGILVAASATTAYDRTVAYDGSRSSSSAYEDAARPPNAEEKHVSGAARAIFARFGDLLAAETGGGQMTTVIGRMEHLEPFADNPAIDTWAKSGGFHRQAIHL